MLVIFTILHRLLCHIWLILLAGIYGGISMGWNVKHPTKWVSYRLLYKTFWVSPSLEAWLKWLHGFSIFFGSKVKVFAALLSGGSNMLFRGCVERVNIWEWGHGAGWESALGGSQTNLWWKALDPGGGWKPGGQLNCYRKRKNEGREGYMGKGLGNLMNLRSAGELASMKQLMARRGSSCKAKSLGPSVGK